MYVTHNSQHTIVIPCLQAEKQRQREDAGKKMLEERARYIEKTKNILLFDNIVEDKPRRGGKVGNPQMLCRQSYV